jgi:hypothetical protein
MKIFSRLGIGLAILLFPFIVQAGAVNVTFTPPTNAEWITVVLVSEISEDYSQSYGQRSDPGADSLIMGNIRASTNYFFKAYRLIPGTWEKSGDSPEFPFTTPERMPPEVYSLPPIECGNVILDIKATVIEP